MSSIESALWGVVVRDPELKTSAAGKAYMPILVRVGEGDAAQFCMVTCFAETAQALAGKIEKGSKVYAEGKLSLNRWTGNDGVEKSGLAVAAWKCETPAIGRNKPRRAAKPEAPPLQPSQRPPGAGYDPRRQGYAPTQQQRRPDPAREREFWEDDPGYR
jgi:single-stranded DNA-binding protein